MAVACLKRPLFLEHVLLTTPRERESKTICLLNSTGRGGCHFAGFSTIVLLHVLKSMCVCVCVCVCVLFPTAGRSDLPEGAAHVCWQSPAALLPRQQANGLPSPAGTGQWLLALPSCFDEWVAHSLQQLLLSHSLSA